MQKVHLTASFFALPPALPIQKTALKEKNGAMPSASRRSVHYLL
jgi:hypothetical protein